MRYINKVDITSGRRLHIAEPIDDRLIFVDAADILQDIADTRYPAWYEGLFAYCLKEHALYVWLDANGNNPNVPYNLALLPTDFSYGDILSR